MAIIVLTANDRLIERSSVKDTSVALIATLPGTVNKRSSFYFQEVRDEGIGQHTRSLRSPEGWIASAEEELRESPTSLTEETEKRKVWQARASVSNRLCV